MTPDLPELRTPKHKGRSQLTVPQRTVTLIQQLKETPRTDKKAISWVVTRFKGDLLRFFEVRYVRSALTDIRAAVRAEPALGADHPALAYLHLNDHDQKSVNTYDRVKVSLRHTSLRPIDPDYLVDTAIDMLGGTWAMIATGLAMLCGRRPYEIFSIGRIWLPEEASTVLQSVRVVHAFHALTTEKPKERVPPKALAERAGSDVAFAAHVLDEIARGLWAPSIDDLRSRAQRGLPVPALPAEIPNPFNLGEDEHVIFTGQAKQTKLGEIIPDARTLPFRIPVLTHPDRIVDAFVRLRSMQDLSRLDDDGVNKAVATPMRRMAIKYRFVDESGEQLQIKQLRAAYAAIAYDIFGPRNVTMGAFLEEILGHAFNETSTLSYMQFYVVGRLGDYMAELERTKSDQLLAALKERDTIAADPERRETILPKVDERIVRLESVMHATSIDSARRRHGEKPPADVADVAEHVRVIARELSPAQAQLVREVGNGKVTVSGRERISMEILESKGVLETTAGEDLVVTIGLTDLGVQVRDALPPAPIAANEDSAEAGLLERTSAPA